MITPSNGRPATAASMRRIRAIIDGSSKHQVSEYGDFARSNFGRFHTRRLRLRVFTFDHGRFDRVSGSNVLLYWPHGFGDWAQLSLVLPFLNPSNRYWITRWGDDAVTLLDGHTIARPICLGVNEFGDGTGYSAVHLGIDFDRVNGGEMELELPENLYQIVRAAGIDCVLCGEFPEPKGRSAAPFHTKPRNLVRHLSSRLPPEFLRPLRRTISLDEDPLLFTIVRAKLQNYCGYGDRRLCLIAHRGQTSQYKNWGNLWRRELPEGHQKPYRECVDFMKSMLRKDPRWMFLLMEERQFSDSIACPENHCFTYREVFGEPATACAPLGRVMKCLVRLASLCVGVPTGPYHLAAQVEELPTVGIWLKHLPSWYDEPRDGLVHVIGQRAAARLDVLPGSFLERDEFAYKSIRVDTRIVPAEAVMAAVEMVLGKGGVRHVEPREPTRCC